MTGCEFIKCPDFKDGKCTNQLDYISRIDGGPMCPKNDNAIPRNEEIEKCPNLQAILEGMVSVNISDWVAIRGELIYLLLHIKELEEGIEKHKSAKAQCMILVGPEDDQLLIPKTDKIDTELYKLIEK